MNNHSRTLATRLFAAGLLLAGAGSALAAVHYVDVNSINSFPPYATWATAASGIQEAVEFAEAGDEIVVTNGTYSVGGRSTVDQITTTNRVVVDKPLALRSVNGPQSTIIDGGAVFRCVYLTNDASLSGFTLTNGRAHSGGGVWCESTNAVVSNCVIVGNSSSWGVGPGGAGGGTLNNCTLIANSGRQDGGGARGCILNNCTLTSNTVTVVELFGSGGGASHCTLNNCTLNGNSSDGFGGGARYCTLNNCTLTGNSAIDGGGASDSTLNNCTLTGNSAYSEGGFGASGGGAYGCTLNNCTLIGNRAACLLMLNSCAGGGGASDSTLNNCIVYSNTAPQGANYFYSTLNYSCTTPLPTNGVGNITDAPPFVNLAAGNYRLRPDSPCIDAGTNFSASLTNDLDGRPRPLDGNGDGLAAFDMGAYEYRTPLLVWQDSPNPTPPHADWASAAHTIQDAVDAALPGDEIVVTNGIYATGGRAVDDWSNRVAIDKALTLRSVNGPLLTSISGGGSNRCVYLSNGANLSGFTLTQGLAKFGAGVACAATSEVVSNCVLSGNAASNGVYSDSLPPPTSAFGGGAFGGTLNNCILSANHASAYKSGLRFGSAFASGGGAYACIMNNCTLMGNDVKSFAFGGYSFAGAYGGGAGDSTLNNCTLTGNSADGLGFSVFTGGGGASYSTLNNCTLNHNRASYGGGASGGTLNNCTLTGNSGYSGGGAAGSTLNNCIVYFNLAPQGANYDSYSTLNYSCTTPQPTNGAGNISLDPQLASASYLSAASPCRGAGNAAYASGTDIDGEPWASPPSIGCDEYHAGAVTGALSVSIAASFTNVPMGFTVQLTALIEGRTTASVWDFGDGIAATNQPYTSHAWTALGDYAVVVRAFNESQPGGISATTTVHVVAGVYYVATDSANPVAPYTSWATAATNIQNAVDAATVPGALVLVTNGIYAPIEAYKLLTVRSVNGPRFTIIDGGHSNRCVYLDSDASLSGFTLTNGFSYSGGGAYGGTLNYCTLSGNSAESSGGGALSCTLNNCTLTGNSAYEGGGAYGGTLNNCTLTGNAADQLGGGALWCTLNNCIVYFNTAPQDANYLSDTLNYSCTTPLPTNGVGNITNAPLFVDQASGNLRLQSNSPCINAGLNAFAPAGPDLDGNPRIVGYTVDMGAYEFQLPPQLTITASGTNVILAWPTNYAEVVIQEGHYEAYFLQSTIDLILPVVWSAVYPMPVVVNGQLVVTNAIDGTQRFYRLVKGTGPLSDVPCLWAGPNPCPCRFHCVVPIGGTFGVWSSFANCRDCPGMF